MNPDNDMTVPSGSLAFLDSETPTPNPGHPVRVWLVDDNGGFRSLLAEMLAAVSGFDCSREFSSAEAVLKALAKETPPDVILLDNQMPGQYGSEVVRPIRALAPAARVLMLTTCFDSRLRQRVLRDGAADFLQKFCSVEEIAQRIHAALARPVAGGLVPAPAEEKFEGVETWASTASMREEIRAEKGRGGRFNQPASCHRHEHRGPRAVWAGASGRLLRGAFQFRSWLSLLF